MYMYIPKHTFFLKINNLAVMHVEHRSTHPYRGSQIWQIMSKFDKNHQNCDTPLSSRSDKMTFLSNFAKMSKFDKKTSPVCSTGRGEHIFDDFRHFDTIYQIQLSRYGGRRCPTAEATASVHYGNSNYYF